MKGGVAGGGGGVAAEGGAHATSAAAVAATAAAVIARVCQDCWWSALSVRLLHLRYSQSLSLAHSFSHPESTHEDQVAHPRQTDRPTSDERMRARDI